MSFDRFDPTVILRPAGLNGPRSSEDWNDTIAELVSDFQSIADQWNNKLVSLLSTIPDGTDDTLINAYVNGLDGRTFYIDSSVTSSSASTRYYYTITDRPKTVKEGFDDVYSYVDSVANQLQTDLQAASSQLTAAQKTAIGDNIFDSTTTSSSSSLDGKSENNRLNIIQLAKDMYGSTSYTLDADGNANLTNSVQAMVNALLQSHGGNWDDDIGLTHSGITIATQAAVPSSASYNDSYAGSPSNTEDDLNQIRTRLKTVAGTTTWTSSLPSLYAGGADSLKDLLDATQGTGTQTATNPWGYNYTDIDGLNTRLSAIVSFTGMDSQTDSSPNYSSNVYVADGTSLETAIGSLDSYLNAISGQATIQWWEEDHFSTGVDTFRVLSGTPRAATYSPVGYALQVFANGVKMAHDAVPSGISSYYYNSGSNRVEYQAMPSGVHLEFAYLATV